MNFVDQVIGLARDYKRTEKRYALNNTRNNMYLIDKLNGSDWLLDFSIPQYFRAKDIKVFVAALVQLCKNSTPAYKPKTKRVRVKPVDEHQVYRNFMCMTCTRHFLVMHPLRPGLVHCPKCAPCPDCERSTRKMAEIA